MGTSALGRTSHMFSMRHHSTEGFKRIRTAYEALGSFGGVAAFVLRSGAVLGRCPCAVVGRSSEELVLERDVDDTCRLQGM
jgi:hypothetical protein